MLKIGVVKWKGKCSRHPTFDPYVDGPGAIRGACPKCTALLEIHGLHQKMMALMRTFTPPADKKKVSEAVDARQIGLFG
jgi:hypothetical protein